MCISNVQIIVPTDEFGGSELVLKMIADELKGFYNVSVIYLCAFKRVNQFDNLSVSVLSNRSKISGYIKLFFFLIKNPKSDLVISSQSYLNFFLGVLRGIKLLRTRNLVFRESTLMFRRYFGLRRVFVRLLYSLGYRYSDLVICSTTEMLTDILHSVNNSKHWKTLVLSNPVNLYKLNHDGSLPFEVPINSGEFIVAAGRFVSIKGFDFLINAFGVIKGQRADLKLLILGNGPEKARLQKIVSALSLDSYVLFPGYVKNPIPFFRAAKVCVVPSLIEGFPNVLLQMISQNTSVVSTVCTNSISKIEGLFTCSPGNSEELSHAITSALCSNQAEKRRILFDNYLRKNTISNYNKTLLSLLN